MTTPLTPDDDAEVTRARRAVAAVFDPEIPVLTVEDLGILRGVARENGRIVVRITPTYTACPATLAIRLAVETALLDAGLPDACVETVLSPAWSTDAMTQDGRRKLRASGIAPPVAGSGRGALFADAQVDCPRCGSARTVKISEFGSTACKAQWRCESCREPFDYFKCY